jgi:hypothetical protein
MREGWLGAILTRKPRNTEEAESTAYGYRFLLLPLGG